jgi:hypothetical protein
MFDFPDLLIARICDLEATEVQNDRLSGPCRRGSDPCLLREHSRGEEGGAEKAPFYA